MVDMPIEFQPRFTNPMMSAALTFINTHIGDKRVLIHCNQGQSRSPSLGLVYLATKNVISSTSYQAAVNDFISLYKNYNPGTGISLYLQHNWQDLVNNELKAQ
jgi:protein-tyrosine phosphatase